MLCDHSSLIYQEIVYVWSIADIHKVVDIADILASEGCKHSVALPPSPLGLAIAAAILASTRPAGPCCCNPCCANSVSLQRAMCAVPTSANCTQQCAAIGSSRAQCRVQQQDRGQAGVRSILCVPYIHHRCTPHLPHATQKERIARRDGVRRRIAGLLSCAHTLAHYD